MIQFERVEWLAAHLRALAASLIEGAAEGLDAGALARLGRRLVRDPRELVRAAAAGRAGAHPGRSRAPR